MATAICSAGVQAQRNGADEHGSTGSYEDLLIREPGDIDWLEWSPPTP